MSKSSTELQASSPIYSMAAPAPLVGRAWNLTRLFVKPTIKILLVPVILFAIYGLLASLPAFIKSLSNSTSAQAILLVVDVLLILGALFLAGLGTLYCVCILVRLYATPIFHLPTITLKQAMAEIRAMWLPIIGQALFALVVNIALGIGMVIVILVGVLMVSVMVPLFAMKNILIVLSLGIVLIVVGCIIVALLISMSGLQMLLHGLQFVAMVVDGERNIFKATGTAFALVFNNLPRALLFGGLAFVFSVVLAMVLQFPANAWMLFEYFRIGMSGETPTPGNLPAYVTIFVNIWHSCVTVFLIPMVMASVLLFCYDCRCRREGLDLSLSLQRLQQRLSES